MCVCGCLCLSRCLSGRFNYEGLCHTNNILQVHCWGCLVVQVMIRALMTSLMTSQDHKVGQILKLIYLLQYLSYSVDQILKMSEMLMAIVLVYSTSGITYGKKSLSRAQNGGHFRNFEILNTASIWLQIWKDRPKLCQESIFMMMTSSMASQGGLKVSLCIPCLGEIDSGSKLQGQCLVNKCQYHNCLSRFYMPKSDLNE